LKFQYGTIGVVHNYAP
jgi:hypothetical protein